MDLHKYQNMSTSQQPLQETESQPKTKRVLYPRHSVSLHPEAANDQSFFSYAIGTRYGAAAALFIIIIVIGDIRCKCTGIGTVLSRVLLRVSCTPEYRPRSVVGGLTLSYISTLLYVARTSDS